MAEEHAGGEAERRCTCGVAFDSCNADWRFNGKRWEHYHGYPVGHSEVPDSENWESGFGSAASPASVSTGGRPTTLPIIKSEQIGTRTKFTVTFGFATEEDADNFSRWVQDSRRASADRSGGAASGTPDGEEAEVKAIRERAKDKILIMPAADAIAQIARDRQYLLSLYDAASRELADLRRVLEEKP